MRTVVLLSGGMDSMLAAEIAKEDTDLVGCLFVDYGQPARVPESTAARTWCHEAQVPIETYRADFDCSAIGGDGSSVIGGRNAILLSLGVNYAFKVGADQVWYGANGDDGREYPDCSKDFLLSFGDSMFRTYGVQIGSPVATMSKAEIYHLSALKNLVDISWSCYTPVGLRPCGQCYSCKQIQAASSFRVSPITWKAENA